MSPTGRAIRISSTRLVSLAQRAVAAIRYEVETLDGPTPVVVQSELVANEKPPVAESDPRAAAALASPLHSVYFGDRDTRVLLEHSTHASGLTMAAAMDHIIDGPPHIASLAGTWIGAVAGFGGMRDHDGILSFNPRLPQALTRLAFRLCVRGRRLLVEVGHEQATYSLLRGSALQIVHHGEQATVHAKRPVTRPIPAAPAVEKVSQPAGRAPRRRGGPSRSGAW